MARWRIEKIQKQNCAFRVLVEAWGDATAGKRVAIACWFSENLCEKYRG